VADQEFFTHPETPRLLGSLGFEIIGIRELLELGPRAHAGSSA
jgi:hypothetical protein